MDEAEQNIPKPVPIRNHRTKKSIKAILVLLPVIALPVVFGIWKPQPKDVPNVLPENVVSTIDFPVYFPSLVPEGYTLDKSSVRLADDVLFYNFDKGTSRIYVTEQAAPSNPPDFKNLTENTDFREITIDSGKAISGVSKELPTVIMLTNTTLINITGTKDVPSDVVISVARNMRSL